MEQQITERDILVAAGNLLSNKQFFPNEMQALAVVLNYLGQKIQEYDVANPPPPAPEPAEAENSARRKPKKSKRKK